MFLFQQKYWPISLLSSKDLSLFIHGCRSFFHFLILATGIFYAFVQPLFLNVDVWTFIYVVSAFVLAIDAYVLFFYKQFKAWKALYFIDALFIALVLYKTGFVFFNFLYTIWLMSILLVGFQFRFLGAFAQAFWVSFLFAWLNILSPHFEQMSLTFFCVNSFVLFLMACISGFIGNRYGFFHKIFQWIYSGIHDFKEEWNRFYALDSKNSSEEAQETNQKLSQNALNQFLKSKLYSLVQSSSAEFDMIDVNHLVKEVMDELYSKSGLTSSDLESSLEASHSIMGQKENLKRVLYGVIQLFASSNNFKKLSLKTYDGPHCTAIQIKGKNMDIKNPLWLFNSLSSSFSYLFFIHKILSDHKGKIYAEKKQFAVTIEFSLDKKNEMKNSQSVS